MSQPIITQTTATCSDVEIKFTSDDGRERSVRVSVNNGYLNLHFCGLQEDVIRQGMSYANGMNIIFQKNLHGC